MNGCILQFVMLAIAPKLCAARIRPLNPHTVP